MYLELTMKSQYRKYNTKTTIPEKDKSYSKCILLSDKQLTTSTAAINARVKPVPVSIEPKRESPILQDINCAPGATPFNKGSYQPQMSGLVYSERM